jgi:hypothetical protein
MTEYVMTVRCTNSGTQRLSLPWMDDSVAFDADGTAEVPGAVGERLVEAVAAIEAVEPVGAGDNDSDDGDATDGTENT